jgi:AraC-like DNA-binding protein
MFYFSLLHCYYTEKIYLCEKLATIMQQAIDQMLLRFFYRVSESISYGESIFIGDNLESDYNMLDFTSTYSKPFSFPLKLTFTSALLCKEGCIRTIINRNEFIISRNDVLVVQGGSVVEMISSSTDLRVIGMAFEDSSSDDNLGASAINVGSYIMHRSIPLLIHLDDDEMQRHIELYKNIHKFYKSTDPAYRGEIVKGYLQVATGAFLSVMKKNSLDNDLGSDNRREQELYIQFLDNLQLYAGKERTVSFYADKCCVSPKYFSKMIHRASGKTPLQLIRERVIIEAKVLLNSTDMSIQQIADALNFPNDSFFCRYFRQEVQMTPMRYREEYATIK